MGTCCSPSSFTREAAELLFSSNRTKIIELIYKSFRVNPFHNYGTLRQKDFITNYINYQSLFFPVSPLSPSKQKKMLQSFDYINLMSMFIFDKCKEMLSYEHKWALRFNLVMLKSDLYLFSRPDVVYIHILLFIFCNTKNTISLKEEFINDIIFTNFFTFDDKFDIDIEKLKMCIKSLIKITLCLFECFILLFGNMNYSQIKAVFTSIDPTQIAVVHQVVFGWIKGAANEEMTFELLQRVWEHYVISPISFAGYSNEKNIRNYHLILQDEICKRLLMLFDCDVIIYSFVHLEIHRQAGMNE